MFKFQTSFNYFLLIAIYYVVNQLFFRKNRASKLAKKVKNIELPLYIKEIVTKNIQEKANRLYVKIVKVNKQINKYLGIIVTETSEL